MAKKRKLRRRAAIPRPALGRNPAVRPGAGPHALEAEKRAAEKLRRELEEQAEDRDGGS